MQGTDSKEHRYGHKNKFYCFRYCSKCSFHPHCNSVIFPVVEMTWPGPGESLAPSDQQQHRYPNTGKLSATSLPAEGSGTNQNLRVGTQGMVSSEEWTHPDKGRNGKPWGPELELDLGIILESIPTMTHTVSHREEVKTGNCRGFLPAPQTHVLRTLDFKIKPNWCRWPRELHYI